MQVRDGPAAVRGDALRHDATGFGREGGGGGAPSQKTCRPPQLDPLAEGRIRATDCSSPLRRPGRRSSCSSPAALGARVSACASKARRTTDLRRLAEPRFEAGANALDALDAASARGEFFYEVKQLSFGPYVDQIGRYPADALERLGVQGQRRRRRPSAPTRSTLKEGDACSGTGPSSAPTGGPKTLSAAAAEGLLPVLAAGRRRQARDRAAGAVLLVDGRACGRRGGAACPGAHKGLVRATLAGAVRSNAVSLT